MRLADAVLLPGVVVDNNDPKHLGRIKVAVPGKWDTSSICVQNLPWVMPFTQSGYQSFSKQENGSKVWVIDNTANLHEYWYIPMFDMNENTSKCASAQGAATTLLSRDTGIGSARINYNSKNGLEMSVNNCGVAVKKNGNITIQGKTGTVDLSDNKVIIGGEGETEPVILADKLEIEINKIREELSNAMGIMRNDPHLVLIYENFGKIVDILHLLVDNCKSTNVEAN